MDDLEIVARIGELSDEEHALERAHSGKALSEAELDRLRAIEVVSRPVLGPPPPTAGTA